MDGLRVVSPAEARTFVAVALSGRCPAAVDTATLLVSELVTNAMMHTDTMPITVEVTIDHDLAHLAVSDDSPFVPSPRPLDPLKAGGFGLNLVEMVAARWGVDDERGTRVWFELATDGLPA